MACPHGCRPSRTLRRSMPGNRVGGRPDAGCPVRQGRRRHGQRPPPAADSASGLSMAAKVRRRQSVCCAVSTRSGQTRPRPAGVLSAPPPGPDLGSPPNAVTGPRATLPVSTHVIRRVDPDVGGRLGRRSARSTSSARRHGSSPERFPTARRGLRGLSSPARSRRWSIAGVAPRTRLRRGSTADYGPRGPSTNRLHRRIG